MESVQVRMHDPCYNIMAQGGLKKEFQAYSMKHHLLQWHVFPFVTVIYPLTCYIQSLYMEDDDQSIPQIVWTLVLILHLVAWIGQSWTPSYKALSTLNKCDITDKNATFIHVSSKKAFGKSQLCPLIRKPDGILEIKYLEKRLEYDPVSKRFQSPKFPTDLPLNEYFDNVKCCGMSSESHKTSLTKFGQNYFDVSAPTFLELFKQHASAPFFVFQLVCAAFWLLDEYWKTSMVTVFMLVMVEAQLVYQRLRDIRSVHEMRPDDPIYLRTLRDGTWQKVKSTELVPMDIVIVSRRAEAVPVEPSDQMLRFRDQIEAYRQMFPDKPVPKFMENALLNLQRGEKKRMQKREAAAGIGPDVPGVVIPCDLVLLQGSVVMNESSLTGESVPQRKEALTSAMEHVDDERDIPTLDLKSKHKGFTLYAGTRVVLQFGSDSSPNDKFDDNGDDEENFSSNKSTKTTKSTLLSIKKSLASLPPLPVEDGAIACVVRTGCHTTQGKIVRTILASSERIGGSNREAFIFLFGLLVMAIAAIWYVVKHTLEDPTRSRFKLFLSSAHILMAVVPPDFAVMLSCATTLSLLKLYQLKIFCTEPFRVPLAGRVVFCAFDKTGTLTSDEMEAVGVFGLKTPHQPSNQAMSKVDAFSGAAQSAAEEDKDEIQRAIDAANSAFREKMQQADAAVAAGDMQLATRVRTREERQAAKEAAALAAKAATQRLKFETRAVLAACHSLSCVDGKLVGDGLELAGFYFAGNWNLKPGCKDGQTFIGLPFTDDASSPAYAADGDELTVLRRFAFDSTMRRMTVVVKHTLGHGNEWRGAKSVGLSYPRGERGGLVLCKGAPSTIATLLDENSSDVQAHLEHASHLADKGFRVIALAYKWLSTSKDVEHARAKATRKELETGLKFAGLLVLACPIKPGTKVVLDRLRNTGHQVAMITGDAMLTACRVSVDVAVASPSKPWAELVPIQSCNSQSAANPPDRFAAISMKIKEDNPTLGSILSPLGDEIEEAVREYVPPTALSASEASKYFVWRRACDGAVCKAQLDNLNALDELSKDHNLAICGGVLGRLDLSECAPTLPFVSVFARTNPQQKETILSICGAILKLPTLMCGDGTNDVGALKSADVGISLMNQPSENLVPPSVKARHRLQLQQQVMRTKQSSLDFDGNRNSSTNPLQSRVAMLEAQMADIQAEGSDVPMVRLGDASIAAPFSYPGGSIACVGHLIRCGRAVQAAVVQLYMVTALSSLVSALSMSVLRLDGLKSGDMQATLESLILMTLMMSVSRAPPAPKLTGNGQRPPASVFEPCMMASLLLQGIVHAACLLGGWWLARQHRDKDYDTDIDGDFKPNDVNTAVFLMRNAVQASCFLANYEGEPFLLPLKENTSIKWGALIAVGTLLAIGTEAIPELNALFECTPLANEFLRSSLLMLLILDVTLSCGIAYIFREWRKKRDAKKLMIDMDDSEGSSHARNAMIVTLRERETEWRLEVQQSKKVYSNREAAAKRKKHE